MPTNIKLPTKPEKDPNAKKVEKGRVIENITFFGDSAIPEDDPTYKKVYKAAKILAQSNYVIVNGGGPGLMKAATDGAESVNGETAVVYWEPRLASFFEGKNLANIADETESQANYITRTFGLIERGDAYIVCEGGTGTVSEFGLVWALAKLYFGVHKPVILFGDKWPDLINSFKETMNIDEKELGVLYYATKPEEILDIIQTHERKLDRTKLKNFSGDESAFLLSGLSRKTKETYEKHAQAYHSKVAQNQRLVSKDQLDDFIKLVNPPAQVLDLGCGPGFDAAYLAERYAVTAIEISKRFAEIAQFENPNVNVINEDMLNYDMGENKFKGIWARDSIHHVHGEDLPKLFEKISNALVKDGIFYAIVREGEGEIVENENKTYAELERFYHLFTAPELTELANNAGLEVIKIDHTKRSHRWLVGVFKKT